MLEGVARTHQPLPRPEGRHRGAVSSGAFTAAQVVSWPPASQTVWFSCTVEWGVLTQPALPSGGIRRGKAARLSSHRPAFREWPLPNLTPKNKRKGRRSSKSYPAGNRGARY